MHEVSTPPPLDAYAASLGWVLGERLHSLRLDGRKGRQAAGALHAVRHGGHQDSAGRRQARHGGRRQGT